MVKAKLSDHDIDSIVNILTGWRGKLTWELLVDKVAAVLGRPFTRQGLDYHAAIKRAFTLAKTRLRKGKHATPQSPDTSVELAIAVDRVDVLQAEVTLLKQERNALLETFATWLYNARNRGLSERDLNRPLPVVERHGSDRK